MTNLLKNIDNSIKSYGYNLRERANIYAGALIGFAAPIVAARYIFFPHHEGEFANTTAEGIFWTASVIGNVLTSVFFRGIPLLYSTMAGATSGTFCANSLMRKRMNGIKTDLSNIVNEAQKEMQELNEHAENAIKKL